MSERIVTVSSDRGVGSLRDTLQAAQPGDTIRFAANLANQTLSLDSSLEIAKTLTLDGSDAPGLTLSGNNTHRVLHVTGVGTNFTLRSLVVANGRAIQGEGGGLRAASDTTLTIENAEFRNNTAESVGGGAIYTSERSHLTITHSRFLNNDATPANSEHAGGAILIWSESQLTVRNSEFIGNRGTNGGAINNLLSQLTLENSIFRDNTSSNYGGAIYTDGASINTDSTPGAIVIRNSRFENNQGAGQGGGLFLFAYPPDTISIENSVIAHNQVLANAAGESLGGGLRVGNGKLSIRNTAIVGNQALQQGGGLWIGEQAPATIANTLFADNQAVDAAGTQGLGGAILFANGTHPVALTNTTFANNKAGFQGGTFWGGGDRVTLTNSLVVGSVGNNPWNNKQHTGVEFGDGGGNFQFPAKNPNDPSDVNVTNTVTIADPLLEPLQLSPQGIPVISLRAGSPAINSGIPVAEITDDLRGLPRTDGAIDSGAIEFGTVAPTPLTDHADTVVLTGSHDLADALGGNDTVAGLEGNDTLSGSAGDDLLFGNVGDDWLLGGTGNDVLLAGRDADWLFGNAGEDVLYGNVGEDRLFGGRQNDRLYGGQDNDILFGNLGIDTLSGDLGDDTLFGGQENDTLLGGMGNDVLGGDLGNDVLFGGDGGDRFVVQAQRGSDIVADFRVGEDKLLLQGGLSFGDFQAIAQDNDTLIRLVSTGELLVTLRNVPPSQISPTQVEIGS